MKSVGTITLGCDSEKPRTIELTDIVRSTFKDNRVVTVARDEENGFLLSVENMPDTGRNPKVEMYLSEGSFVALFLTMTIFF